MLGSEIVRRHCHRENGEKEVGEMREEERKRGRGSGGEGGDQVQARETMACPSGPRGPGL